MKQFIRTYKPSAILAIFCGLVTILLGVITVLPGISGAQADGGLMTAYITITITLFINLGLHIESFITNIKVFQKRQDNVLSIALVEAGYVLFLIHYFVLQSKGSEKMDWQIFAVMFAAYIWVNASSLTSMPINLARNFGIVAMVTGFLMYALGQSWSVLTSVVIAICLIVNGYERVKMSLLGGKKKLQSSPGQ